MAKVAIIMGSDSDLEVMSKSAKILEEFGIEYEMKIISAHRQPDVLIEYMADLEEKGFSAVIAGAGKAAALPGMCAALTPLPVIGIPMKTSDLGGVDSLYSIVQMPSGVPVATVAINGALNAGLLAAKIIAVSDKGIMDKVKKYAAGLKDEVNAKGDKLEKLGYKGYLEQK
ncbi:MAG: 5-(carboxyamino)imidazole ribonucleotide mutase [Eubacterium sp.]|nr:5-(carboxyamino)imidazole ribonucleotide mutase [Eubacterium sp.]